MAAPTFVDYEENGAGADSTTAIFNWADVAGVANDDVALVGLYREDDSAYDATPTDWAQVSGAPWDQTTGGLKFRADLWWKRRTAGDTGAQQWEFPTTWRHYFALVFRGLITTETPIIGAVAEMEAAQNTEPGHPGITIARSNSGLAWFVFNNAGTQNAVTPTGDGAGFTLVNPASDREVIAYYDLSTVVGAYGAITGDLVNPEYPLSVAVELITEAAAGGGRTTLNTRPFPAALSRGTHRGTSL
jgi:hypothetical protein